MVIENNAAEMSGGGPQISGRWFNPKTGDAVNVRDAVIEGDIMYVITDKGRLSMEEFQNYIQDEGIASGGQAQISANQSMMIPQSTQSSDNAGILTADTDIYGISASEQHQLQSKPNYITAKKEERVSSVDVEAKTSDDEHQEMIDKIFSKGNVNVDLEINIKSDNFPVSELQMLQKFFDVTADDIAIYIKNKYFTQDKIKESIEKYITSYSC